MVDPAPARATGPSRRRVVAGAAAATAGLVAPAAFEGAGAIAAQAARPAAAGPAQPQVANVTGLYTVPVARIEAPASTAEVAALVTAWPGRICIGGGRYSMGGQIGLPGALHLDMRAMNGLVWLHPASRTVRVQAGMRWRDLQDHLDPLGLAVRTMQSYANFTVGGSVSVNVHGRYVGHGPIAQTVRGLQLVLADGSIVEARPDLEPELYAAALGGYGAVGVVTEVELDLAENVRIERVVHEVPLAVYPRWFADHVLGDPAAVLHNADLMPPHFDAPVGVTWRRAAADRPLTETARLVPRGRRYAVEQGALWLMTEVPGADRLRRQVVHPLLTGRPAVKWLNHEASLDVAELEPRSRAASTYVLQEYFVPEARFLPFARAMAALLRRRGVMALNVSIRHSPADRRSLLAWAAEDVFSFVLYYKQRTGEAARREVAAWSRELAALALAHGGRWYLPYQIHATREQFEQAYPQAAALRRLKQRVDPQGRFGNQLWSTYWT